MCDSTMWERERERGEKPVKKCASSLLVDLQGVCVCVCWCVCLCACMCVDVQSDDNMVRMSLHY